MPTSTHASTSTRSRRSARGCALLATLVLAGACASSTTIEPVSVSSVRPASGEQLALTDIVYALDASSSMGAGGDLASERNLLTSLARAMPEGSYGAGLLVFGGSESQRNGVDRFRRDAWIAQLGELEEIGGDTRLASAIDETRKMLPKDTGGRRAVVLISDGVPRGAISDESASDVLRAADRLVASSEELCLHTIQIGRSAEGTALLNALAEKSPCGSFRHAADLQTAGAIQSFERNVFFVASAPAALPPVAARSQARDGDRDGVLDERDQCRDTPFGVVVQPDGCWQPEPLTFDNNSSLLTAQARQELGQLAAVLQTNPEVSILVVGHADATGEKRYNEWLSERRANRVRNYLIEEGIGAHRISVEATGDAQPLGSNDTDEGRSINRRAEILPDRR